MIEIKDDGGIVYFDVDDTLVMWDGPEHDDQDDEKCTNRLKIGEPGFEVYVTPHTYHVEQIIRHKARGHTVIVWSQGGWQWASMVVRALGLENYVDVVMSKPDWYYDDLPSEEFMGKPYYFKLDKPAK